MNIRIASMVINIDNSLINHTSLNQLGPFEDNSRFINDEVFSIIPIKNHTIPFNETEPRICNQYFEDSSTLCLMNNRSLCKIDKKSRIMEVVPGANDYSSFNIITELKYLISLLAIESGGCMFHSAGMIIDQECYLFTGASGSGKTTLATHMSLLYPVLNDEIIIIILRNGIYCAATSPFGSETIRMNQSFEIPIKKIYTIKKSLSSSVEPLSQQNTLLSLLSGVCMFPTSDTIAQKMFDNVAALSSAVPHYLFRFSKSDTPGCISRILSEHI